MDESFRPVLEKVSVHIQSVAVKRATSTGFRIGPFSTTEERKSYTSGTTWGWVNEDWIFIIGWTVPVSTCYSLQYYMNMCCKECFLQSDEEGCLSAGAVERHLCYIGILSFQLLLAAFSDHIHDQSDTDKNEQHYADHLLMTDKQCTSVTGNI